MLRGNAIEMQVTAGGTGNLTVASVTGKPSFQSMLGSTGTRPVRYVLLDANNGRLEGGRGLLNLATGVLSRDAPSWDYDGTNYRNWPSSSPISFPVGSKLLSAPTVNDAVPPPPRRLLGTTASLDVQFAGSYWHVDASGAMNNTLTQVQPLANTVYFSPFKFLGQINPTRFFYNIAVAAAAGGRVRSAVYDCRADFFAPGRRLWADDTEVNIETTGWRGQDTGTSLSYLPPGWYWSAMQFNASVGTAIRIGAQANTHTQEGNVGTHATVSNVNLALIKTGYNTWANIGDNPTGLDLSGTNGRLVQGHLGSVA